MSKAKLYILVVGGDGRLHDQLSRVATIRVLRSTRFGGNGDQHAAIAAIRAGGVKCVVVLVKWIGHSETEAIYRACRVAQIRRRLVHGGLSAARRMLGEEVRRG